MPRAKAIARTKDAGITSRRMRTSRSVFAQKLFVERHPVDALLGKLKRCKENSINDTRAAHGHTET
jgi:hypothetical protein